MAVVSSIVVLALLVNLQLCSLEELIHMVKVMQGGILVVEVLLLMKVDFSFIQSNLEKQEMVLMQELQAHQQLEASYEKDQGVFTKVFIAYNFFKVYSFDQLSREVLSIHYNHNQHINLHLNLIMISFIHLYSEAIVILVTFYFIDKGFMLVVLHSFIKISCSNCSQLKVVPHDFEPQEEEQASITIMVKVEEAD